MWLFTVMLASLQWSEGCARVFPEQLFACSAVPVVHSVCPPVLASSAPTCICTWLTLLSCTLLDTCGQAFVSPAVLSRTPGTWYSYMLSERLTNTAHMDGKIFNEFCFYCKVECNWWKPSEAVCYCPQTQVLCNWMGICHFRSHCHSRMCLCTLPGKSGSCWTQLRDTCTGAWCWRTTATWHSWVSTAALGGPLGCHAASRLLQAGGWRWSFWKILSDRRLLCRCQVILVSHCYQNMLFEWCLFSQSTKGQLRHAAS